MHLVRGPWTVLAFPRSDAVRGQFTREAEVVVSVGNSNLVP